VIALGAWLLARGVTPLSAPAACDALARARIVHVFALDGVVLRCQGVQVERASAEVERALAGDDAEALASVLRAARGSAIALLPQASRTGLGKQLASFAHVRGLRAAVLAPEIAVYAPVRELALSSAERDALAYVARALFRGAREPSVSSFPPSLRRLERVEVLVMLSARGEPRLWRSARGTSIARALLTATRVARDRWREREQAMGGPLSKRLLELDVEIAVLSEDGTLPGTQRSFVDAAITSSHGIGFDHRTAWHYVLPREVARRKGGAFQALTMQISEQGLTTAILSESDTRVYRFVSLPLGLSKAPLDEAPRPPE